MAVATINLRVEPFRLLTKGQAAHYCGLGSKTFAARCPVTPVAMPNGEELYDVHDLDGWIDTLKGGAGADADAIIARLR